MIVRITLANLTADTLVTASHEVSDMVEAWSVADALSRRVGAHWIEESWPSGIVVAYGEARE
jgi:hypothetical protein